MTTPSEPCELLALAVDDEDTFWLCQLRHKALSADWKYADVFWLYPVTGALPAELETVEGFDPTDLVYELPEARLYSRISRRATLSVKIPARQVKLSNGNVFFFVTPENQQEVEEAYRAFLKNEELLLQLKRKEEQERQHAAALLPSRVKVETDEPEENPPNVAPKKEEEALVQKESRDKRPRERSVSLTLQPRRRSLRPTRATKLNRGPKSGLVRDSHEVAQWDRYFIVTRGGVSLLCPAFTGNTYGYRLQRVADEDFSVFLLFLSTESSYVALNTTDYGTPVLECAALSGEETSFKVQREVMVFTRAVGCRNGAANRPKREIQMRANRVLTRQQHLTVEEEAAAQLSQGDEGFSSSGDESSGEDSDSLDGRKARRPPAPKRPRKEGGKRIGRPPLSDKEKRANKAMRQSTAGRKSSKKAKASEPEDTTPSQPLLTIGVNRYTDPGPATPPAAQMAQVFPFAPLATVTGLTTAVLPHGVCVTYTPATASKVAAIAASQSQSSGATSLLPDDGDMRDLLENILLAKEQASATL